MEAPHPDWITAVWKLPRVHAFITTRSGGVSTGPFGAVPASSSSAPVPSGGTTTVAMRGAAAPATSGRHGGGMNIGMSTGDDPMHVQANRARLRASLPGQPCWLRQVHGATVVDAAQIDAPLEADASFSTQPGIVCAVSVADCLPVFLAERDGRGVAVAHAGWRGLAAGVLQNTARALRAAVLSDGGREVELAAFLGPGIGPDRFEVGPEVLEAMLSRLPDAARAFLKADGGKFFANLPALARQALAQEGVRDISGGNWCTASDAARFYSFRRDRVTGRHAAVIWLSTKPDLQVG